jgi:ABC-type antimicrobial peptide transport system permease subunit
MLFSAGQRRQEMGIRMAMGARGGQVIALVLRSGLSLTASGTAFGAALSVMVAGVLDRFVYGVSPADPLVWGSVVLLLTGSALLASLVPALRAARSDPLATLRTE